MPAYYNEHDPRAAAWLRELIKAGLIALGDVDERSVEDIRPAELAGYEQCHFFAGIGGWSYALRLAGWPDDRPVWTGSCPCQPFSQAGKRAGVADERHLWPAWFHLIHECRPRTLFGEQVASCDGRAWIDLVQSDLEGYSYTVAPIDLCAAGFGLPHVRNRFFWVAENALPDRVRWQRERTEMPRPRERIQFTGLVQRALRLSVPTGANRLRNDDVPGRMAILRGFGNAIVAETAAEFIRAYTAI